MANNTLIGALRAEATLESGKFVDGAKKIRAESKKTEVQVKSSFSAMGASIKGFGGALTAGLSIGLLGGLAKKALDFASAIGVVAKQLGVTTKELQEFRYAASQVGVVQAEADKGLEKLGISMSKAASGSKTATAAFASVGVSIEDIKTKTKTQIFGQMADQMIKQGGASRNLAAGTALMGEGFAKLVPLADKGSKGLNELSQAAHRLGVVLSDSAIQSADETARKLDDVKKVLAAQIAGVVAENASSIVTLANALATLTSSIVNFLGSNPTAALAILGALAGSRFGLPGAAAGAFAGSVAGAHLASRGPNPNRPFGGEDVPLLRHNTQKARDEVRAKLKAGQTVTRGEADRLRRLTAKLNEATGHAPSGFGNVAVPDFLAGDPKAGRKGRTPRAPRDRSDDVSFQFDQELRRAQIDVLRAQQGLARTSDERARIALQLLSAERETQEAELNNRVRRAERDFAEGKITESALEQAKVQAEKLRAEYDSKDALERKAIADDLAADKARDAAALVDSAYDLRLEQLQTEAALAETSRERRAAELRILDLMKQQEKARLEAVIADKDSSELAKAQAQQRKDQLDKIYAGRAAAARQGTRGPMESFQAEFGDISEELENLKVQGIMGAVDALAAFSEGWESMRDVALGAIKQILAELIRLQLMKLAVGLIGGASGGISNASINSLGASNMAALSAIPSGIPGFAGGGSFDIRGRPGIDRNMLQLNGMNIANVSYGERLRVDPANDAGTAAPPFIFNNYAKMSAREARQTGMQAAAGFRHEIARSAKQGY